MSDIMHAIDIIEGVFDADEEQTIEAWQCLVDTGVAWELQGRIGRAACDMINAGIITMRQP